MADVLQAKTPARLAFCCRLAAALWAAVVPSAVLSQPASEAQLQAREDAFSERGFVTTRQDPVIARAAGGPAWKLDALAFAAQDAPPGTDASLWRHTRRMARHGLFKIADGIWQVRGFDIANATFIKGDTGWIVIDPLMTRETAAAALALANETLGARPVSALIYTHPHVDHFGGAAGMIEPGQQIPIYAPAGFLEAAAEDLLAGGASGRRAIFQFGAALSPGPAGRLNAGIGMGLPTGTVDLLPPNKVIDADATELTIDGVAIEVQLTQQTEAAAELHLFFPETGVLDLAENANPTLHNLLPPRGAPVRSALAWAKALAAALDRFGAKTHIVIGSHGWPRFGNQEAREFIAGQRDSYRYLHDQTVRLINEGLSADDIASEIALPPQLAAMPYNRGYYGSLSFNARAVYQHYLGFYNGNPANLDPLKEYEEATRLVSAIGGPERTLAQARQAVSGSDLKWAAKLYDALLQVQDTQVARLELSELYRRLAMQTGNAVWRNIYLTGAQSLRANALPPGRTAPGVLAGMPSSALLDLLAVRLNGPRAAAEETTRLDLAFTDRNELWTLEVLNGVLHYRVTTTPSASVITGSRAAVLAVLMRGATLEHAMKGGEVSVSGSVDEAARLVALLGPTPDKTRKAQ